MTDKDKTLQMLEIIFGEAAEGAQRGASRQLERWATAFDRRLGIPHPDVIEQRLPLP